MAIALEVAHTQEVGVKYGYRQGMKFTIIALCLPVLISSIVSVGELYKWIDKDGVVNVTDDPVKRVSVFFFNINSGLGDMKIEVIKTISLVLLITFLTLAIFTLESYPNDCKSPDGNIVFKNVREGMCPEGSEEVKNDESMKPKNVQTVDCKSIDGYIITNIRKGMCPKGYEEVEHEEPTQYRKPKLDESSTKERVATHPQKTAKNEILEQARKEKPSVEETKKVSEKDKGGKNVVSFGVVIIVLIILALHGYFKFNQENEKERRLRALKLSDIDNMDGHEFEHYVGKLLEHQGFKAEVTKGSGDLGVDVIAQKNELKYAVQVKRYNEPVSRRAVSDAVAGKYHYGCNKAMVVTTSHFTEGAKELAQSTECKLVDRDTLAEWILDFQNSNKNIS